MQDKAKLTEQAVNRFVEMALARQIKDADKIEVRLKFELNRLMRGETDSILIKIQGLLLSHHLRVSSLQLEMGQVAVKPLQAMRRKIILVEPVAGWLTIELNEQQMAEAINNDACLDSINQRWQEVNPTALALQSVTCQFQAEGTIAFKSRLISQAESNFQSIEFAAVPSIDSQANQVCFQNIQILNIQILSETDTASSLAELILQEISEALQLQEFEQQAVSLKPQQLELMPHLLRIQFAAHIEQFPSS